LPDLVLGRASPSLFEGPWRPRIPLRQGGAAIDREKTRRLCGEAAVTVCRWKRRRLNSVHDPFVSGGVIDGRGCRGMP